MVTLEQLLESRDRRAVRQRQLLEAWPGLSLVCFTVQLPGTEKRNAVSLKIADAGVEAIRKAFSPEYEELKDLETGFEGFFVLSLDPFQAKRITCEIEDTHPLGRLMDIDVLTSVMPGPDRASARPTASENYFSGRYPKNQFSDAIANPAHADAVPVGREDIGLPPRRCLLCGKPARFCMRAKSHTTQELLDKIDRMLDSYLNI